MMITMIGMMITVTLVMILHDWHDDNRDSCDDNHDWHDDNRDSCDDNHDWHDDNCDL